MRRWRQRFQGSLIHSRYLNFRVSENDCANRFYQHRKLPIYPYIPKYIHHIFQGCRFHDRDACPDCMFAQLCGNSIKTNQCNFMKHLEMPKLFQEHAAKIEGKAIRSELSIDRG